MLCEHEMGGAVTSREVTDLIHMLQVSPDLHSVVNLNKPAPMNGRGSQLAAVVICFLVLTVTTVALRCYVRVRLTGGFGADDALSVASLVCLQQKSPLAQLIIY